MKNMKAKPFDSRLEKLNEKIKELKAQIRELKTDLNLLRECSTSQYQEILWLRNKVLKTGAGSWALNMNPENPDTKAT